jgi:hypothetical protein
MHRHWILGAAALLLAFTGSAGAGTRREAAAEELYWAFHACEEGLRTEATPADRARLLEDYRFRRARAVHSDRAVLRTSRVRDYVVRDWLARCDVTLPRQAEVGRKEAAQTDAATALAICKAATDRGSLEAAEADYRAFKEKSKSALRLDPKLAQKKELLACDKRVSDWIARRRDVEAEAIKRVKDDAEKKSQLTIALH